MILIKNGRIVNPLDKKDLQADVLIKGQRIEKICGGREMEAYLQENVQHGGKMQVLDAAGCVVAPGFLDVHVHFRDPGFCYKEDILSGSRAALAGGFTKVVLMANTRPVVDNAETLRYVLDKGKETKLCVESCACISKGLAGKELVDMALLKELGAAGFTDDGIPLLDENFVRKAMEEAARLGMPLSFHEESPRYISENGINHGEASAYYGIGGSDRMAEIEMIRRDIRLAEETGAVIDIQHISTKEGVALVREARKQCGHIYAEAAPHHFSLTEKAVMEKGTLAKMNPPLRTEADRQAVMEGLADGTISIIATDHAPHSAKEKARKLTEAPSGIIGLETALPLAVTYLVREGHLSLMQVLERMVVGPAELYGFVPESVEEGREANLVVFHAGESFVYEKSLSRSQNSPFLGQTLYGRIHATVAKGEVVYQA